MRRPANTVAPARSPAPGVIRDGEVYRLAELQRRLGWHEHAVRQARLAGLRLIPFGREKYVLGSDALEFFRRLGARASDPQTEGNPQTSAGNGASEAGVDKTFAPAVKLAGQNGRKGNST